MKRLSLFPVILTALALFGFGCLRLTPRIVQAPANVTPTENAVEAVVVAYVHLNGNLATVTRGSATTKAEEATELVNGDTVKATSGTVELVYPGAGISRLEAGSQVQLIASNTRANTVFAEARLLAGTVWTRFERLLAPDEHFSVVANGVVATVRGTGFGVSLIGQDVDVQVADHEVDVALEAEQNSDIERNATSTATSAVNAVRVMSGQELRIPSGRLTQVSMEGLKARVRSVTKEERALAGFLFGNTPIPAARLRTPVAPVKLDVAGATLSPDLIRRLELLKLESAVLIRLRGFVAPTRGATPVESAPVGMTPQVNGPSTTGQ